MTGVAFGLGLACVTTAASGCIPAMARAARLHPHLRILVWCWTAQCILAGFGSLGALTGLVPWAPWASVVGVVGLGLVALIVTRRRVWHMIRHPELPYPEDDRDPG